MSEAALQRRIMVAVSQLGARVFRNQVGAYREESRFITYGLAPGSSDLIGWASHTIQPEDVGRSVAIFLALEVKTPTGRLAANQANFLRVVDEAGGVGAVVRSPDDAREALLQWKERQTPEP